MSEGVDFVINILGVKGIPIVCLKDDSRAGYVGDALYDSDGKVCGFTVESMGFSLRKKMIPLDEILRINDKNCIIYSEKSIVRIEREGGIHKKCSYEKMIGKNVENHDGKGIGVVKDVVFDIETGEISGFELTRGFMEDTVGGRRIIYFNDGVEFGKEFIVAGRKNANEKS